MADCEIIAHRGWSAKYPENTLKAFDEALQLGVTGCECDVHLSKDGVPYLMHDHSFARTTGHSAGSDELTMAEIATLDAGHRKDPAFAGEPVPTLEAALQLHRDRGHLLIEIKDQAPPEPVALRVAETIRKARSASAVSLIAFDFDHLVAAKAAVPEARAGWLLSRIPRDSHALNELLESAFRQGVDSLSVHHAEVTQELADKVHALDKLLWVWTVNSDDDLDRVLQLGVDSVTSDRPDWLLERLA